MDPSSLNQRCLEKCQGDREKVQRALWQWVMGGGCSECMRVRQGIRGQIFKLCIGSHSPHLKLKGESSGIRAFDSRVRKTWVYVLRSIAVVMKYHERGGLKHH
jgi:hypothetical protein